MVKPGASIEEIRKSLDLFRQDPKKYLITKKINSK